MNAREATDSLRPVGVLLIVLAVAALMSTISLGIAVNRLRLKTDALVADLVLLEMKPTPAAGCKSEECEKELAVVDARFGDVWDELVEVQEQLAKVKSCDCGPVKECCCEPSKSCACSDKPACECKPAEKPAVNSQVPVRRVFKRCK